MACNLRWFGVVCFVACAISTGAAAQQKNVEMTVLADQIRSQGYPCSNPSSVERLAGESVQDEPDYLLKCDNATYRIRLVPDQAAKVTRVK